MWEEEEVGRSVDENKKVTVGVISPCLESFLALFGLVGVVALTVGGSGEVAFVGGEQRVSDDTDSQRGH